MYTNKLFESYNKELNESEKLEEKRNPENDEANELIRNSLNNDEYAKNHTTELRKHGIKYIPPEKGKEWRGGALEGKEGRRLATISKDDTDWYKGRVDKVTDYTYNDSYGTGYLHSDNYSDRRDLHQKTYKDSKEKYKNARDNIKKQEAKVKRMEKKDKEAGLNWNEKTYDAQQKLKGYQDTIEKGIQSNYKSSDKIHPDTDLKSFLNAKKHSDRPLPREKDPKFKRANGKIADPANKDVEDYKEVKSGKSYIARQKEQNKQQDQEDKDRIADMKRRAKEEKNRRDMYLNREEKEVNKMDSKIQSKLDAYRKRMTNK